MSAKILFIHNGWSTFVQKDYQMLSERYDPVSFYYRTSKKLADNIRFQLELLLWLLRNIWKAEAVYIWFADYHALLPVLAAHIVQRKSIMIIGGYDAVAIEEIKFGLFIRETKSIRKFFARTAYKYCKFILPVDESLINGVNNYTGKDYKIGFKYFVPELKGIIRAVATGYDPEKWYRDLNVSRKKKVLSIGIANDLVTYYRKGFDLLIEIAGKMTDVTFVIIGLGDELKQDLQGRIGENVELISKIPNHELNEYFSGAKVFCQLSISEGLPNTLCEAMLCECIPVGSNVNGIPHVISDCGFILDQKNSKMAISLIRKALASDDSLGRKARERIISRFSFEQRKKIILTEILDNKG